MTYSGSEGEIIWFDHNILWFRDDFGAKNTVQKSKYLRYRSQL